MPEGAVFMRAAMAWCALLAVAFANGLIREAWIVPRSGELAGHMVSSAMLAAAIFLVAGATIRWIAPAAPRDALVVGAFWLVLTLVFEFGAGHFLFGRSWSELLRDYNLFAGRLWILVLAATMLSPVLAARARGLFDARPA